MNYEEIVKWLRSKKVETGSLLCLGCSHEHNCCINGCAVMRAAADAMENLQTENASLRHVVDNILSEQALMVKEFTAKLEELAQVKAERGWISVEDSLPEGEKEVLCWYEYFRYGDYNRMFQTFGIGCCINGYWGGEVSTGTKSRVLYWMPLPEPPGKDA